MKAPHFATISVSLDTQKYRSRRPEEREGSIFYLLDRLLSGEEVAQSELEHYGFRVTAREAYRSEILR